MNKSSNQLLPLSQELKEKLAIKRLDQVYCRLKPSPIHGIGVFAIKTIPKGVNPFKNSYQAQEAVLVSKKKIKQCDEVMKLLDDYHPSNGNSMQIVSNFPNQLIWTNYINYSTSPNLQLFEDSEWKTLRDIEVGEELLENPKNLFNEDGSQKVFSTHHGQYPIIKY